MKHKHWFTCENAAQQPGFLTAAWKVNEPVWWISFCSSFYEDAFHDCCSNTLSSDRAKAAQQVCIILSRTKAQWKCCDRQCKCHIQELYNPQCIQLARKEQITHLRSIHIGFIKWLINVYHQLSHQGCVASLLIVLNYSINSYKLSIS